MAAKENKGCWFCAEGRIPGQPGNGFMSARKLGLPAPEADMQWFSDENEKTLTFYQSGLPCPVCNYEELTREQVVLYIGILSDTARKRREEEGNGC